MPYKAEFLVEGEWAGNAVVLETEAETYAYGLNLLCRWTATADYRVVKTDAPVNYSFLNGYLESLPVRIACTNGNLFGNR